MNDITAVRKILPNIIAMIIRLYFIPANPKETVNMSFGRGVNPTYAKVTMGMSQAGSS